VSTSLQRQRPIRTGIGSAGGLGGRGGIADAKLQRALLILAVFLSDRSAVEGAYLRNEGLITCGGCKRRRRQQPCQRSKRFHDVSLFSKVGSATIAALAGN
jgi:hypothetical protein